MWADCPNAQTKRTFRKNIQAAERMLSDCFYVGDSMTLADVAMGRVLLVILELNEDLFRDYPRLLRHVRQFLELPTVAAYLSSDRRLPL